MNHVFIERKDIDLEQFDNIVLVEECMFCDVQRWTWVKLENKKIKTYQYMLKYNTQYWDPDENCNDTYGLRKKVKELNLFHEQQLNLF